MMACTANSSSTAEISSSISGAAGNSSGIFLQFRRGSLTGGNGRQEIENLFLSLIDFGNRLFDGFNLRFGALSEDAYRKLAAAVAAAKAAQ